MKPINEYTIGECANFILSMSESMPRGSTFSPLLRDLSSRLREIHSLTRWIPVTESLPTEGETVLVKGICNSELYGARAEPEIGLVSWGGVDEFDEPYCKDTCYYAVWYTNITHWRRIDTP